MSAQRLYEAHQLLARLRRHSAKIAAQHPRTAATHEPSLDSLLSLRHQRLCRLARLEEIARDGGAGSLAVVIATRDLIAETDRRIAKRIADLEQRTASRHPELAKYAGRFRLAFAPNDEKDEDEDEEEVEEPDESDLFVDADDDVVEKPAAPKRKSLPFPEAAATGPLSDDPREFETQRSGFLRQIQPWAIEFMRSVALSDKIPGMIGGGKSLPAELRRLLKRESSDSVDDMLVDLDGQLLDLAWGPFVQQFDMEMFAKGGQAAVKDFLKQKVQAAIKKLRWGDNRDRRRAPMGTPHDTGDQDAPEHDEAVAGEDDPSGIGSEGEGGVGTIRQKLPGPDARQKALDSELILLDLLNTLTPKQEETIKSVLNIESRSRGEYDEKSLNEAETVQLLQKRLGIGWDKLLALFLKDRETRVRIRELAEYHNWPTDKGKGPGSGRGKWPEDRPEPK